MPDSTRLSVSRRIPAPAQRIFEIVADPRGHVEIDGSGMLMAAPDAVPLRSVGDTFEMDVDREPLGDVPMGKYKVTNTVTLLVENVEVAWTVGTPGRSPIGHVYGYRLEPISETETEVTNYCDWSAVSEKWQERISWPVVPAEMLERSLLNLERTAARSKAEDEDEDGRVTPAPEAVPVTAAPVEEAPSTTGVAIAMQTAMKHHRRSPTVAYPGLATGAERVGLWVGGAGFGIVRCSCRDRIGELRGVCPAGA